MREFYVRYGQRLLAGIFFAIAAVIWGELLTHAQAWWVARAAVTLVGAPLIAAYGLLQVRDWRGVTRELVDRERSCSDHADAGRHYGTLRAVGRAYAVSGLLLTLAGMLLLLDLIMT